MKGALWNLLDFATHKIVLALIKLINQFSCIKHFNEEALSYSF